MVCEWRFVFCVCAGCSSLCVSTELDIRCQCDVVTLISETWNHAHFQFKGFNVDTLLTISRLFSLQCTIKFFSSLQFYFLWCIFYMNSFICLHSRSVTFLKLCAVCSAWFSISVDSNGRKYRTLHQKCFFKISNDQILSSVEKLGRETCSSVIQIDWGWDWCSELTSNWIAASRRYFWKKNQPFKFHTVHRLVFHTSLFLTLC